MCVLLVSNVLYLYPRPSFFQAYNKGTKYKGKITLDCYYAAKTDTKGKPEFCVYAYPKNMTCRADDDTIMQEWIDILNLPGIEDTGGI